MTDWEPATEVEAAMRDALRANDQELYFRILARTELLLPVSAQALAGQAPMGWGTWTTGGRTHVLAFTSTAAQHACLGKSGGSSRRAAYHDLAANWPNHEWWLAVNPGLPVEGYLPAWFVSQLSRGDVRLPGRTMGARARLERAEGVAKARATAVVPGRDAPIPPAPIPPAPVQAGAESAPVPSPAVPSAAAAPDAPTRPPELSAPAPPSRIPPPTATPVVPPHRPPAVAPGVETGQAGAGAGLHSSAAPPPYLTEHAGAGTRPPAAGPHRGSGNRMLEGRPVHPDRAESLSRAAQVGNAPPPVRPVPAPVPFAPLAEDEPATAPSWLNAPRRRLMSEDTDRAGQPNDVPVNDRSEGAGTESVGNRSSFSQQIPGGDPSWNEPAGDSSRAEWAVAPSRFKRASQPFPRRRPLPLNEPANGEWSQSIPRPSPPQAFMPAAGEVPESIAEPVSGPPAPRRAFSPIVIEGTVVESRDRAEPAEVVEFRAESAEVVAPSIVAPAAATADPFVERAVAVAESIVEPIGDDRPTEEVTSEPVAAPVALTAGPAAPECEPANDVEEDLLAATGTGSTDTFLSTLLLARVLLPVAPDSAPGCRPGDAGFVWRTEELDGETYVVVYTSPERLADRIDTPVETVRVKFVQLIRRWPDNAWSFAVNPGTSIGAKLPGEQIVGLANWAAEVGLGDDNDSEPAEAPAVEAPVSRPRYAPPVEDPARPTMMQKAVAPSQIAYYLDRGYDRVSGFVHRANEVAHLNTPAKLHAALGLGYPDSPFSRDADEIYVLRWPAYRPSLYRIPYGGQNEGAMRAMEGWVIERPPFRGNGFAPGESNDVVAEFKVDSARLPYDAQLWRIGADGTERVIAILDTDSLLWRKTGEQ